jgi:hypothetical protein
MSNFTDNGTANPSGSRRSLSFKRAQFVLDAYAAGVRQHTNIVTGFLDASVVYGSSEGERACVDAVVSHNYLSGKVPGPHGTILGMDILLRHCFIVEGNLCLLCADMCV